MDFKFTGTLLVSDYNLQELIYFVIFILTNKRFEFKNFVFIGFAQKKTKFYCVDAIEDSTTISNKDTYSIS